MAGFKTRPQLIQVRRKLQSYYYDAVIPNKHPYIGGESAVALLNKFVTLLTDLGEGYPFREGSLCDFSSFNLYFDFLVGYWFSRI